MIRIFFRARAVQITLICLFAFEIACFLLASRFPEMGLKTVGRMTGAVICVFLISPFILFSLGTSDLSPDKIVQYLDLKGYGEKRKSSEVRYGWEGTRRIAETKRYILIKPAGRGQRTFVIYKRLLPEETIHAIREILEAVSVESKKLAR